MMIGPDQLREWNTRYQPLSAEERLTGLCDSVKEGVVFSTSLGEEDQVITDMIARRRLPVTIFTLDTGRLFPETYQLIETTQKKYDVRINIYFPDTAEVEQMVNERGINLFYQSVENRKLCCYVRKVKPLQRALRGAKVWIVGLRRAQSITRQNLALFEWDEDHKVVKCAPLFDWSLDQVKDYIARNDIPVNPLHERGYVSIGCAPCTRPIRAGEDIRAGRWWWEQPEHKECGLHISPNPSMKKRNGHEETE